MAIAPGAYRRLVAEHATNGVEIHAGIDHLAGRAVPQIVQSCVAHARASRAGLELLADCPFCPLRWPERRIAQDVGEIAP